jgi:hypothetical protein
MKRIEGTTMRSSVAADSLAVLRTLRMSLGLPRLVSIAPAEARKLVVTFDRVVMPIVEEAISDEAEYKHLLHMLRSASVKMGFLLLGYAAMAGEEVDPELIALSGPYTRIYDDLFDEVSGAAGRDERLALLFDGGGFAPANDIERLLLGLHRAVEGRIAHQDQSAAQSALIELHSFQIRSREQGQAGMPDDALVDVTHGKGAYGLLVLFSLVRPKMSPDERRLVLSLGGTLQQIDDYQDVVLDHLSGVTTLATRGQLDLNTIVGELLVLRADFARCHGVRRARKLFAIISAMVWISFSRRHWPALGTGSRVLGRWLARTAVGILVRPGDNTVLQASQRRTERQA